MAITIPKLTYRDLAQFPNDGKRREIIDGELHVAAAPSRNHQEVVGACYLVLDRASDGGRLGRAYVAPVDVNFGDDSNVQPDAIFIRAERLAIFGQDMVRGAPDIVVEVLSPSTRVYDLTEKLQLYEREGVPEVWYADPSLRQFRLLVLREGRYVEAERDEAGRWRSQVLPHLAIDAAELFARLD